MDRGTGMGTRRGKVRKLCLLAFSALSLGAVAAAPFSPAPGGLRKILITGNLRDELEPTSGKIGSLGGLARRATLVREEKPDLVFDAGNLVLEPSPYDLLKLRFLLRLDHDLGYSAVNVGRREAGFSVKELTKLARESPVPILSANLVDTHGRAVFPGHLILKRGESRFAVIGLVTVQANPGPGLRIEDPLLALRRELLAVRKDADFVILLSGLTTREAERCLEETAGVDLVVGGYCPSGSKQLERIAGVPCFLVQGKGQYVGEVLLSGEKTELNAVGGQRVLLDPSIPSDSAVLTRIQDFERSLEHLDLLGDRKDESPYVGSAACAACHEEAYRIWKKSGHAKAISALTGEKGRPGPRCVVCHTTAPAPGGSVSEEKAPESEVVGCESCHGPSRAHAEAPFTGDRPRTPGDPEKCLRCHQADHGRPFHRAERLKAIRHWDKGRDR